MQSKKGQNQMKEEIQQYKLDKYKPLQFFRIFDKTTSEYNNNINQIPYEYGFMGDEHCFIIWGWTKFNLKVIIETII
ncbi:unnamed protein product [Paramecium sonneborni]|uniref:Uncharacterized protein n=1 Tax=Paramecium sonneborni TaxID=65129 RepID=A0A8S1R396_9CILI|nr:unnamed protein product [Paramecium sonneborni]